MGQRNEIEIESSGAGDQQQNSRLVVSAPSPADGLSVAVAPAHAQLPHDQEEPEAERDVRSTTKTKAASVKDRSPPPPSDPSSTPTAPPTIPDRLAPIRSRQPVCGGSRKPRTTPRHCPIRIQMQPASASSSSSPTDLYRDSWGAPIQMPDSSDPNGLGRDDHGRDPTMKNRFRFWMAIAALACMWTNAQAPLFMFSGAPVYIYRDIGGVDRWVWFVSANLLATAVISPFVGNLSDLFGRRWVAVAGNSLIVLGQILCGSAVKMDTFIAGMALSGLGTGMNELTALAGVAEMVPVSQRGYYVAGMIITILPFLLSVLWAQLIAHYSTWRYIAVVTTGWALAGLVMTLLFYHPPPRVVSESATKRDVLRKMDFVGGILSILGLLGLEMGLLGGGYRVSWSSAQVLVPLVLGIGFLMALGGWERWGTEYPMVPRSMGKHSWTLVLTLIITFISGANFFSVIMIWPSEAYNIYGHDPVGVGIRGMPFAFGTLAGCVVSLVLLSWFRGHIKWILFSASLLMTAGCGGLAAARTDNIQAVYGILFVAGIGVGGIVVPASMVTGIICPPDIIATITALTIAIRLVGGAIGYAVYYNVFVAKLIPELMTLVGATCFRLGITDRRLIGEIIELTGASLIEEIRHVPGVTEEGWKQIVAAGQVAYSHAYPWAYYCSIAFGAVSMLASLFLGDLSDIVDDSIAVVL
ncbi:putative transporter [Podospora australis]|uniref:Transporter n=1 Tax=Podospora australis TaxID=1536484 RepID=A0AAN6WZB4_9PEZI|nr:putative transporter [Podospora australis]